MQTRKHRWTRTEIEDIMRCYIEEYVLKQFFRDKQSFIGEMCKKTPDITESSMRMFCQNVKQLTLETDTCDSSTFSPLKNYSRQHKEVFEDLICEYYFGEVRR